MYSADIEKVLKKKSISIWDRIRIEKNGNKQTDAKGAISFEGILMPKSAGSPDSLIIKLDNGYNIGLDFENSKITKLKEMSKPAKAAVKKEKYKKVEGLPTISIITTGGTVASRIDYNTGGTHPLETAEEIVASIPEVGKIANLRVIPAFQMFSEDIEPAHWIKLAERIKSEIEEVQPDGIIITHGTDTMHYTSAALSLMLQNLPIPVLIIGSQRSSDRGGSDSKMNFVCAANFIVKGDFSGVAVCMHGTSNDDFCHIHQGTKVRKMHSSRRDTFKSVNVIPYAKVNYNGTIEFLRTDYVKKDKKRKIDLVTRFENNVALVKTYPGFNYKIIESLVASGIRGILLEGSGYGNFPINDVDEFTKHHKILLDLFSSISKNVLLIMTTQTINGNPALNVYSTGRIEQKAGILPVSMTPETAYVKLGWVLGHTKDIEKAKEMMLKNYAGEISDRIDPRAF